jgi:colanic acid biosynthesis protein WcaH
MKSAKFISDHLYKIIVKLIPIPCVDAVIVCRGKFLLGKRVNEPGRGKWYFIGGRILKGETLRFSVRRKIREEVGYRDVLVKKLLTTRETIFKKNAQGSAAHTINSIFLVEVSEKISGSLDGQHSELRWFSRIDSAWPAYVRDILRLAGFK